MYYLRTVILLFTALLSTLANAASIMTFTDAYVAAAPPGAAAMAAYMSIENPGDGPRRITAISSRDFAEVQIHRSSVDNGVARMQQLEYLAVEPASTLELKPGGIHLMLIDPVHDFEQGEMILLELKEADGTVHTLSLKVRRVTATTPHH
jgi:periplasmic copper chaperone A